MDKDDLVDIPFDIDILIYNETKVYLVLIVKLLCNCNCLYVILFTWMSVCDKVVTQVSFLVKIFCLLILMHAFQIFEDDSFIKGIKVL